MVNKSSMCKKNNTVTKPMSKGRIAALLVAILILLSIMAAEKAANNRNQDIKQKGIDLLNEWLEYGTRLDCEMQSGHGVMLIDEDGEAYIEYDTGDGSIGACAFTSEGYKVDFVEQIKLQKAVSPVHVLLNSVTMANRVHVYDLKEITGLHGEKYRGLEGYVFEVTGSEDVIRVIEDSTGLAEEILVTFKASIDSELKLVVSVYRGTLKYNANVLELVNWEEDGYVSGQLDLIVDGKAYIIYDIKTNNVHGKNIELGEMIYECIPEITYQREDSESIIENVTDSIKKSMNIEE